MGPELWPEESFSLLEARVHRVASLERQVVSAPKALGAVSVRRLQWEWVGPASEPVSERCYFLRRREPSSLSVQLDRSLRDARAG